MTTTLPIPIAFSLPDGWQPGDPDRVGAPGAAFVARHPEADAGFTPTIAIDGEISSTAVDLADHADASLRTLERAGHTVRLLDRRHAGSAAVPGLSQVVALLVEVDESLRSLVQHQAYLAMIDQTPADGVAAATVVVRLVLTAPRARYTDVVGAFRELVASVRLDR